MENINSIMKFINVIDRYLEVSYVYSQRIKNKRNQIYQNNDRLLKLIALLERAEINDNCKSLKVIDKDKIKGQNVIASEAVFEQTKWYQNIIKKRLETDSYNALNTHNERKLRKLIDMEPEKCLACFKTVSYAWDILTEFASLSFLPSSEKLEATDMIHMHLIELRQYLCKIMAHAKMISPDSLLELRGAYTVKQLNEWDQKHDLVEALITESMHMEIHRLLEEIHIYTDHYQEMFIIIAEDEKEIIARLEQESRGYPDILEEDIDMKTAESLCDKIVLYGLCVGYITWLTFAEENEISYQILFKHCLFCTKTLLDERRWRVCEGIAKLGLEVIKKHNDKEKDSKKTINAYMITANLFFARKMMGDKKVKKEIEEWDLTEAHERYLFLQQVLLNKNEEAFTLAKSLLEEDENERPNMAFNEFREWPILEEFRKSEFWEKLCRHAGESPENYSGSNG